MIDLEKLDRIKTFGNSMYPLLHDGDICYYNKISFKQVKTNDIVLVKIKDTYVIHRVIYKSAEYFITKGDNNFKPDPPVTKNNFIARLTSVKRNEEVFNPEDLYLIQSSYYLKEIINIQSQFETHNIDYLFLKGLPLHLYYENTHPRKLYADCDVLIKRDDYEKVLEIFKKDKYKKIKNNLINENNQISVEESYYKNISNFPIVFDLHIEPAFLMTSAKKNTSDFYPEELLERLTQSFFQVKRDMKVNEHVFPILPAAYLIVYLSLHFFHHNYREIHRLEFISKIIHFELTKEKHLWDDIKKIMNTFKVTNYCYPTFVLLQHYLNVDIPNDILKKNTIWHKFFINKFIIPNVFVSEDRVGGGIHRFILICLFSPIPFYRKIYFIFQPKIVLLGIKIFAKKFLHMKFV